MAKISLEQALRLSLESTKEYIDDNSRVMNYIILKDQKTGVKYKIYMSNGELIAETIS